LSHLDQPVDRIRREWCAALAGENIGAVRVFLAKSRQHAEFTALARAKALRDEGKNLGKIADALASEFNLKKLDATRNRILNRAGSLRDNGLGTLPRPHWEKFREKQSAFAITRAENGLPIAAASNGTTANCPVPFLQHPPIFFRSAPQMAGLDLNGISKIL
jgi:hypothetical protein